MKGKLVKTLLTTVACATFVVGGATATALAAGTSSSCSHDYYLVEDSGRTYDDYDEYDHKVYYWEEIYCMNCYDYIIRTESYTESHTYNSTDFCVDCGHGKG